MKLCVSVQGPHDAEPRLKTACGQRLPRQKADLANAGRDRSIWSTSVAQRFVLIALIGLGPLANVTKRVE